ncbi:MAG: hypothetical protein H6564_22380 [Lewinellaceae bacterium]|nr:hypothetical protein [Lewinellaceae bacterium]
MFSTIFTFELRYWLRQPSIYVYAAIFLLISLGSMWGTASEVAIGGQARVLNAPWEAYSFVSFLYKLIILLLPAVVGVSANRDFQSGAYTILYAYPISRSSYLNARFFSAFLVMVFIVSTICPGLIIGGLMPGVQAGVIGPVRWDAYLQLYAVFLIPNMLLAGMAIFAAVIFTRNIYAGFILAALMVLMQGLAGSLPESVSGSYSAALLGPFGGPAVGQLTHGWTVAERNERMIPLQGVLLYNRLLWLSVTGLIGWLVHRHFAFSQHAPLFSHKKVRPEHRETKLPGSLVEVQLPKARLGFSLAQYLQTAWASSRSEFRYIIRSWPFIALLGGGLLFVFLRQLQLSAPYGVKSLPLTSSMLRVPAFLFLGIIQLLTFLYAGMLVHRARLARMGQLVDTTPAPNWVFLLSKTLALAGMQVLLLSLIAAGGMAVQAWQGYYRFEPAHYAFELFVLYLPGLLIWACAAVFVQSLFTNPYLGFFLLVIGSMGVAGLPELGIEAYVFRFNAAPAFSYSALDGYGAGLAPYFFYKTYWLLFGLCLWLCTLCLWQRGWVPPFRERLRHAIVRARGLVGLSMLLLLAGFAVLGSWAYVNDHSPYEERSGREEQQWKADNEKYYKKFQIRPQLRARSVYVELDIFPNRHTFEARGKYVLVNATAQRLDSLLVHYSPEEETSCRFERPALLLNHDSLLCYRLFLLPGGLGPGDSMVMAFEARSRAPGFFGGNSRVKGNGTFISSGAFPGIGYRPMELEGPAERAAYGLPPVGADMPSDSALLNLANTDRLSFEAIVSTPEEQAAIAPGYLQKEWVTNGRRYVHYRLDEKIKDYYGFIAGAYDTIQDKWHGIGLDIFYRKGHEYNLGLMMGGMKASLAYSTEHFGPYQHRRASIIEFPQTYGRFATTYATCVPVSETYFTLDVDENRSGQINLPFYVAAHEMAHQWWGNQLLPDGGPGAKMLTESLAEYVALKAVEKEYGPEKLRDYLAFSLDLYLKGRHNDEGGEPPLIRVRPGQEYIHYRKGALAFYTLAHYLGEDKLNAVLRAFLEKVKLRETPVASSQKLLGSLKAATPDSLAYLIEDMFETATLYDNRITSVEARPLAGGLYQVDIAFTCSKYRSTGYGHRSYGRDSLQGQGFKGPIYSLPLADYVEIEVLGEQQDGLKKGKGALHLERYKATRINNRISVVARGRPVEVRLGPAGLIDDNPDDNRWRLPAGR